MRILIVLISIGLLEMDSVWSMDLETMLDGSTVEIRIYHVQLYNWCFRLEGTRALRQTPGAAEEPRNLISYLK